MAVRREPIDLDSLDSGLIAECLRRAQCELGKIGLELAVVVRPRRHVIRSASVAPAPTPDDDDPVTNATEVMDVRHVAEAVRLKVISEHDAPRFLGGMSLEQAIVAAHTKPEHLDANGEWDPPPPPLFTRPRPQSGDEPQP